MFQPTNRKLLAMNLFKKELSRAISPPEMLFFYTVQQRAFSCHDGSDIRRLPKRGAGFRRAKHLLNLCKALEEVQTRARTRRCACYAIAKNDEGCVCSAGLPGGDYSYGENIGRINSRAWANFGTAR
jgi:hypothetical protein